MKWFKRELFIDKEASPPSREEWIEMVGAMGKDISATVSPLTGKFGFKAIPHNDCVRIAQSDFLSDETKNTANTQCIREAFCKIWRKI